MAKTDDEIKEEGKAKVKNQKMAAEAKSHKFWGITKTALKVGGLLLIGGALGATGAKLMGGSSE